MKGALKMKLTKEQQIELLNESIQQLMQENTELKKKVKSLDELSLESYNEGYVNGHNDAMWG